MKKCNQCLVFKLEEEFYKSTTYICKKCTIEENNKASMKRRYAAQQYVFDYLKKHPCVDCGENNILTLEFDHKDPNLKLDNICLMIGDGKVVEKIQLELDKCEVRCANCHKIKTFKQQNWSRFDYYKKDLI